MNQAMHEISVLDALRMLEGGMPLLDIREPEETALGAARDSVFAPMANLLETPGSWLPDPQSPAMLICASGSRSRVAMQTLQAQGYTRVVSVAGGFRAWRESGLPEIGELSDADRDFQDRYARHLRLPQVGEAGQRRLLGSSVTVVGAGGLGSPVLFYLAAAGIGHLRVIDGDRVDRSNLQRQILHREQDVGLSKADSAKRALSALNPHIRVEVVQAFLDEDNARTFLTGSDVVVDATDNFPARYLISDTCAALGIPWVYAAIHRFEGQLSVFDNRPSSPVRACYRCLFPQPPSAENAPNCAEAGVLGLLPGVIGSLQASEAVKLLLGIGQAMTGRLLHFDALGTRFHESRYRADPDCRCHS